MTTQITPEQIEEITRLVAEVILKIRTPNSDLVTGPIGG